MQTGGAAAHTQPQSWGCRKAGAHLCQEGARLPEATQGVGGGAELGLD